MHREAKMHRHLPNLAEHTGVTARHRSSSFGTEHIKVFWSWRLVFGHLKARALLKSPALPTMSCRHSCRQGKRRCPDTRSEGRTRQTTVPVKTARNRVR